MTEEKLREIFLATNTEEPLAGGWPGLLRYGMAVSLEAKRESARKAFESVVRLKLSFRECELMAKELE